jgi:hypothetical protein
MKFVYTVWLRNPSFPPDDQDYEWPACFVIDAENAAAAKSWGDHLAERYSKSSRQEVMTSSAESVESSDLSGIEELPIVMDGQDATDRHIGL